MVNPKTHYHATTYNLEGIVGIFSENNVEKNESGN